MNTMNPHQTVFSARAISPARWVVAIIVGYLALLPLAVLGLAAGFDTHAAPLPAVSRETEHHDDITDDPLRLSIPPAVRLRELPTTAGARRTRTSTPR
jgi:hypothetical protein